MIKTSIWYFLAAFIFGCVLLQRALRQDEDERVVTL